MSKVVKFGGSSLASAEQFKKVGNIIRADKERKYVVPSAPGKRFSDDTKVTDMLYACYDLADQGKSFKAELDAIKARYQEIIDGLQLDLDLVDEFKTIEKNFKAKAGSNYAASRGEYLNGIIMANYLGYDFIDAATVIFFDENGEFDAAKTNEVLRARLAESKEAVVPGFYGAMPDGTVKTFSRGGSDITGSIVAKAAKADVYENWTDVSGFLIADPRIISPIVNFASWPIWVLPFFMRMPFSRYVRKVSLSISAIPMRRKTTVPGSWEAPARSPNT